MSNLLCDKKLGRHHSVVLSPQQFGRNSHTKISIFLKYGILCTGLETDKIKGSVFV